MAIRTMKVFSEDKKKGSNKSKRKYNSFEHRVLSGLRDGQTDYIFDMEHLNKIKALLRPMESIWIDKLSGCFFVRLATIKEREKDYFRWCKKNKRKPSVASLNQYNKDVNLIWSDEQ